MANCRKFKQAGTAAALPAKGHSYPPVHGIDVKNYAKINSQRNKKLAFDDDALRALLLPYKITVAQFKAVESTWQARLSDGQQPAETLAAVNNEFNAASMEAMNSAA